MSLYEMTSAEFRPISTISFTELKVLERGDLQRLLRAQVGVLGDDLYVLTEEFGEWEDSRRRIDLLAIDKEANLVVVELKRTTDGGHMELQAIRYAGMISAMTFQQAEEIHGAFLARMGSPREEAQERLLNFLEWDEPDEESFAPDVKILLVSEDFSKELTTAVLWLREREIDIRCVRLCPYQDGDKRFVDVQQIIPLPEVNDYQVQIRAKENAGRKTRAERHEYRQRFWEGLVALARERNTRHGFIKPGIYPWLGASAGTSGFGYNYTIGREYTVTELYIDRRNEGDNKRIFDQLFSQKEEIEREFGGNLSWERLNGKRACRIQHVSEVGGYRSPEPEWPGLQKAMVERMIRLEKALQPKLDSLEL